MTDLRVFYEDPSKTRLETRVVESGATGGCPWVRLEETLFYPEGGGQPADRGTINGVAVQDVRLDGDHVLHFVSAELPAGRAVCELDAVRRFDHCQQHTAQHVLSAILEDRHGLSTTAFHLGEEYTAIEVDGTVSTEDALAGFEREVNREIRLDRRVRTRWVDPAELDALPVRTRGLPEGHRGPVRLVEIEGVDLNTCGGTHVAGLAEIQIVKLLGVEPARGGSRIRMLAGSRVRRVLSEFLALERSLKERLGAGRGEFLEILDKWQAERKRLERRVRDTEQALAVRTAEHLARHGSDRLAHVLPGGGPGFLAAVAREILSLRPAAVVALVGESGDPPVPCFLVQAGPDGPDDVSPIGGRVRDALGAKGGGRGRRFQGSGGRIPSDDDVIRTLLA